MIGSVNTTGRRLPREIETEQVLAAAGNPLPWTLGPEPG